MKIGEPAGVRTRDLLIKSQLLYRLSYRLPFTGHAMNAVGYREHEIGNSLYNVNGIMCCLRCALYCRA